MPLLHGELFHPIQKESFMRRVLLGTGLALLALTACSKPADKPAADTSAVAPAPPPKSAAMASVTVIYNWPQSPAAFEKYYRETHVPLVQAKQAEVRFIAAELTKFDQALDGKKAPYCRQAVLWFNSMVDLEQGITTPGFQAIGDDFKHFVTGGLNALVGGKGGEHHDPPSR